jgi:ABC-type oligopeptide transport system substrate-binding subunit
MKALIALVIVAGLLLVACGPKAPSAPATAGPTGPITDSEVSSLDSQITSAGTDVPDTSGLDSIDSDLSNLAVTG